MTTIRDAELEAIRVQLDAARTLAALVLDTDDWQPTDWDNAEVAAVAVQAADEVLSGLLRRADRNTVAKAERKPRPARKLRAEPRELTLGRAVVRERAQGRCEAAVEGVCTGAHEQTHHRRRRSQKGPGVHDPSNLVAICNACHAWVHANVALAVDLDLLERSKTEPTEVDG